MPTLFTHPLVPLVMGTGFTKGAHTKKLILLGVLFSILPDFDVIAFYFGIPYSSQFGHRGFTHSLFFAAAMGALIAFFLSTRMQLSAGKMFTFLFVSMGSHGLLDMFTDGGLGIALLWPFSNERYFTPVQMIKVSPIGMGFFSEWGLLTLASEFIWIWMPALLIAAGICAVFHFKKK